MSGVVAGEMLSVPEKWERYYQASVSLDSVLGTPGITRGFGETIEAGDGRFAHVAERGFFLSAVEPASGDPVAVCASLASSPITGEMAVLSGARRRRSRRTATGTHVQIEQLVRGARVIGSDARLHEDERGIFAITGRPLGDMSERDPGLAPSVNAHAALEACAEAFGLDDGMRSASVEHVVFPVQDGAIWAYEIAFVVPEDSADVRVYLSADDLSVLLSYNISSAAQGDAQVYAVNPLQNQVVVDVVLEDLEDPGNLLRGPATDVRQAAGTRLDSANGNFHVDPADPEFDEPQAYYQLWRAREYFSGIVDPGLLGARPFTPMNALVNDAASPNNAYYFPTTGELRFGLFGTRSSARSASMVIHEFGHAVTDAICELGRGKVRNTESRGLSEGYSDYFAASLLDDPRFADYVVNKSAGARNCGDPDLQFPANYEGEEHATGAVWAGILWAIREQLGQSDTDRLVIESVDFLDASSAFDDARAALHEVDETLFGGANSDLIDQEYDARAPD